MSAVTDEKVKKTVPMGLSFGNACEKSAAQLRTDEEIKRPQTPRLDPEDPMHPYDLN